MKSTPRHGASRTAPRGTSPSRPSRWRSILWTLFVLFLLRAFVVQAYVIPSESMRNTFLPGDFLLVAKFVYGIQIPYTTLKVLEWNTPDRGDVVVFNFPLSLRRDFVKRCVAVAGDTVEIRHKVLYVNGQRVEEPYVIHTDPREFPHILEDLLRDSLSPGEDSLTLRALEAYQRSWEAKRFVNEPRARDNFGPVVVPEGTIFVMGDNRDNSLDSRFFGPLPLSYVKGRPLVIYFSWDPSGPWWKVWERIRIHRMLRIVYNA